ncbi:MAG: dihydroorotate dehydrogenase electron transfer subunit, partial [Glaciecola sp.]
MTSVTRTEFGPVVEHGATIVARNDEGLYHRMSVHAPLAAARAVPGQFLTLDLANSEHILPRPFSIAGADPKAGTIEVLFAEVGEGTQGFHQKAREGDRVRLVGPLGTGYSPVEGPVVAVGGGYGAAPLTWLAQTLLGEVDLIVGAANAGRLCLPAAAHDACRSVVVATEDGSQGVQGRVTDVLAETIEAAGAVRVYACGPMPMLRAVEAIAMELGVECELATE